MGGLFENNSSKQVLLSASQNMLGRANPIHPLILVETKNKIKYYELLLSLSFKWTSRGIRDYLFRPLICLLRVLIAHKLFKCLEEKSANSLSAYFMVI